MRCEFRLWYIRLRSSAAVPVGSVNICSRSVEPLAGKTARPERAIMRSYIGKLLLFYRPVRYLCLPDDLVVARLNAALVSGGCVNWRVCPLLLLRYAHLVYWLAGSFWLSLCCWSVIRHHLYCYRWSYKAILSFLCGRCNGKAPTATQSLWLHYFTFTAADELPFCDCCLLFAAHFFQLIFIRYG